jgi:hypothetical protein
VGAVVEHKISVHQAGVKARIIARWCHYKYD